MFLIVPRQVSYYKLVGKKIQQKTLSVFSMLFKQGMVPWAMERQLYRTIRTFIYMQVIMALKLKGLQDINAGNIEQVLKIIQNVSVFPENQLDP